MQVHVTQESPTTVSLHGDVTPTALSPLAEIVISICETRMNRTLQADLILLCFQTFHFTK